MENNASIIYNNIEYVKKFLDLNKSFFETNTTTTIHVQKMCKEFTKQDYIKLVQDSNESLQNYLFCSQQHDQIIKSIITIIQFIKGI